MPRVVLTIAESLPSDGRSKSIFILPLGTPKILSDPVVAIGSKDMDFGFRKTAWTSSGDWIT